MGKFKGFTLMLLGAAGGAALAHYLDPDRGRARRAQAADQIESFARTTADEAVNQADYMAGQAKGAVAERVDLTDSDYDVKTLKHKVESEALGPAGVPAGEILVDVSPDNVVTLRGPVGTQQAIEDIAERTLNIDGVRDVVNQLHLPGEPAPNIEPSLEASESAG